MRSRLRRSCVALLPVLRYSNRESLDSHPHAAPEKIKIGLGPNLQAHGGVAYDKVAVGGSSQNNYRMPHARNPPPLFDESAIFDTKGQPHRHQDGPVVVGNQTGQAAVE